MLTVLASGVLVADPRARTTAAGKAYATCLLRVPSDGGEAALCSVIIFNNDAVEALLSLAKGDSVAVTGRATLSTWTRNGEQHHGLAIVGERVMNAYQLEKRRSAQPRMAETVLP